MRLGGVASPSHMTVFQGLETLFKQKGIDIDWVLYSDYDSMIDDFVEGKIDLAWNGPLGYVKIQSRLEQPCHVIAMRDVDINFTTCFVTHPDSDIITVEDLKGRSFAFGNRSSEQAGLLPYYFLKQVGIDPRKDLALSTFFEDRKPGTSSVTVVVIQQEKGVLLVPRRAVKGEAAMPVVWVFQDGAIQRRPVVLGKGDDEWVSVLKGLAAGEQVVV